MQYQLLPHTHTVLSYRYHQLFLRIVWFEPYLYYQKPFHNNLIYYRLFSDYELSHMYKGTKCLFARKMLHLYLFPMVQALFDISLCLLTYRLAVTKWQRCMYTASIHLAFRSNTHRHRHMLFHSYLLSAHNRHGTPYIPSFCNRHYTFVYLTFCNRHCNTRLSSAYIRRCSIFLFQRPNCLF